MKNIEGFVSREPVSREDKVYREHLQQKRENPSGIKNPKNDISFGSAALRGSEEFEKIKSRISLSINEGIISADQGESSLQRERQMQARELRDAFEHLRLVEGMTDLSKSQVELLLVRALYDKNVQATWGEDIQPVPMEPEDFWKCFDAGQVSETVLIAILRQRQEYMQEVQREKETLFNKYREEFRTRLHEEIAVGFIPADDRFDELIDSVQFFVLDEVNGWNPYTRSVRGGRSHGAGIITLEVGEDDSFIRDLVFHEMMHVMAGKMTERYNFIVQGVKGESYRKRKGGLKFFRGDKNGALGRWLDEGMTERYGSGWLKLFEEEVQGKENPIFAKKKADLAKARAELQESFDPSSQ